MNVRYSGLCDVEIRRVTRSDDDNVVVALKLCVQVDDEALAQLVGAPLAAAVCEARIDLEDRFEWTMKQIVPDLKLAAHRVTLDKLDPLQAIPTIDRITPPSYGMSPLVTLTIPIEAVGQKLVKDITLLVGRQVSLELEPVQEELPL